MPVPEASGSAGHPLFAHNAAISATTDGSVTRRASPATITSKPFVATLIAQRGSRATFFALRVPAPVWNQHEPACQSAPTLVTCGLPSAFSVVSQNVERFGDCGSSPVSRSVSCASTSDHSIVGSPSTSPRFVISMLVETSPTPKTHRVHFWCRGGQSEPASNVYVEYWLRSGGPSLSDNTGRPESSMTRE